MIVCKIYVDVINEQKCIVTVLAKKNIGERITNITENDDGRPIKDWKRVYIYPSTIIAISKEAKELLYWYFNNVENRKKNIFLADYTFDIGNEKGDYENNIGSFGFLPIEEEGGTQRKKIFYINKRPVYINSQEMWVEIMESMQLLDNEFLKNLDLTEPVEL